MQLIKLKRRFGIAAKFAAATALCLLLGLIVLHNSASAFNSYQDLFVSLSARPLAMGGAFTAMSGPESVFYNPAGLAGVRSLALVHNHSARHFPGSTEGGMSEWDQLDGDTQVIAMPLPLLTYAHGFTFSGEMGYDYRGHPEDGRLGYPREQYWGTESYDALVTAFGLPLSAGMSLRRSFNRFTPAMDDTLAPAWYRLGEGHQWGILARVWPGLDYGYSNLKHDYDWTVAPAEDGTGGIGVFDSRLKQQKSGWAFHPTGWLTLCTDETTQHWQCDDEDWLGRIHLGDQQVLLRNSGGELRLAPFGSLRWGDFDGHRTLGGSLDLGTLELNYAEIQDFLPLIVGAGESFKNVHIYGFELDF